MKLLIGDSGHIDFDEPIEMTAKQREEFVSFLKTVFEPSVIKEINIEKFRENRLGQKKSYSNTWIDEEYEYLLKANKDTLEFANNLGRSWMSVDIKYGNLIWEFNYWRIKNNKPPSNENLVELIREFLEARKTPEHIKKLIDEIKSKKDWFWYIKTDNHILFEQLSPKPNESDFRKAIKKIKESEEFKKIYSVECGEHELIDATRSP